MRPDYGDIIERLATLLADHEGRIVTTGLREPERWPEWLIRIGSAINRVFGVSADYRDHCPWQAVVEHTFDNQYLESHAGAVYLAAGTAATHPR